MIIEVLDAVDSRAPTREAKMYLTECLSFPTYYYRQTQYKKERVDYQKVLLRHAPGGYSFFWTGFLPRVKEHCKKIGMMVTVRHPNYPKVDVVEPSLKGITFRDDQLFLIKKAIEEKRGLIKSPTGSGKTLLQLGILSCFPNFSSVILAHTKDIVQQTYRELVKFGFNPQIITGEDSDRTFYANIIVSTMQSFVKIPIEDIISRFEMVIIDEAHHVSKIEGVYSRILQNMVAPYRFGFTATEPQIEEAKMTLEGLIGPKIGELSINEAAELGILAVPKVRLLKTPYNHRIHEIRRYPDVYEQGIVLNRARNELIMSTVRDYIKEKKTVLILVTKILHGNNLIGIGREMGLDVEFVQGSTTSEIRAQMKSLLNRKQLPCIIATAVWREGINIPSLDVVINACGGKSEIMTLQAIGRGLRRTDEKSVVEIVDFFDPSNYYLISHFGERISLYMDNNWL